MFLVAAAALILTVIALSSRNAGAAAAPRPPAPAPRSQPIVPAPAPAMDRGQSVVVAPDTRPTDDTTHDGGTIRLVPEGPSADIQIDPSDLPPELLPIVQQASDASEQDLERGAVLADELGYNDVADWLRLRAQRRRQFASAQRAGTAPPPARDVPGTAVSFQPSALPTATSDRNELQRLATRLADNIRRSARRGYDRALMARFQAAAGLLVDGKYGRQSAQALGTYGHLAAGQVPPPQY